MVRGDRVAVIDVAIPWEGPRSLESTFTQKVDYYSDPALIELIRGKYPGKQIITTALVIGARGTWCRTNDQISRLLLLGPEDIRSLVRKVINGSVIIHNQFIKFVYRIGNEPRADADHF